jgi:biopolymer transport protein ExbD
MMRYAAGWLGLRCLMLAMVVFLLPGGPAIAVESVIRIEVDEAGRAHVQGREMDMSAIERLLRDSATEESRPHVRLAVHRNVTLARLTPLLDLLQRAGVTLSVTVLAEGGAGKIDLDPPTTLHIAVTPEGPYELNGEAVELPHLFAAMRAYAADRERPQARLKLHSAARFERLFLIVEQLHYEGIERIDFGLDLRPASRTGSIQLRITRDGSVAAGDVEGEVAVLIGRLEKGAGDARVELASGGSEWVGAFERVLAAMAEHGVHRLSISGREFTLVRIESDAGAKRPGTERRRLSDDERQHQHRLLGRTLLEQLAAARKSAAAVRAERDDLWKRVDEAVTRALDKAMTPDEREAGRFVDALPVVGPDDAALYHVLCVIEQDMLVHYRQIVLLRRWMAAPFPDVAEAYAQVSSEVFKPHRPRLVVSEIEPYAAEYARWAWQFRHIAANCQALHRHVTLVARADVAAPTAAAEKDAMPGYRGPALMPDEVRPVPGHAVDLSEVRLDLSGARPFRRLDRIPAEAEWCYVDMWHLIGPFPGDRRRQATDRRFGPEVHVNLADHFTGRDGKPLAWEPVTAGTASIGRDPNPWMVQPPAHLVAPYAVYYAFTEIHSPRDQDVWIAIGVDDYGKLWVNDELQWSGPRTAMRYNPVGHIQLIHLKKGHNRLLFRNENAGGTVGFSLLIRNMVDDEQP